jgi:hypothetical protein
MLPLAVRCTFGSESFQQQLTVQVCSHKQLQQHPPLNLPQRVYYVWVRVAFEDTAALAASAASNSWC